MTGLSRRRFLQLAAGLPLPGIVACTSPRPFEEPSGLFRVTLSGQMLMAHSLCASPYLGLTELMAELRKGQVVFTDLEVPIHTPASGKPTREGMFLHGTGPEALDCIRRMGFNLLALSNNHAWDYGTAGVLATRAEVIRAGFACAGSGRNLAEASAAGLTNTRPRVALVSAASGKIREGAAAGTKTAGINEIKMTSPGQLDINDVARNLAAISEARKNAAIVIAYLHNHHWGEDMAVTKAWAREYAHKCVDAGADIFVSHGAPLLHGIEMYRGRLLLHGLGSLVFHSRTDPGHYPPEVWETVIVHCDFTGSRLSGVQLVPVVLNEIGDDPVHHLQTRGRPKLATGADALRILQRLSSKSAAFGVTLDIDGSSAMVNGLN